MVTAFEHPEAPYPPAVESPKSAEFPSVEIVMYCITLVVEGVYPFAIIPLVFDSALA